MSSPSLNKLYSELLVSKNRLSILRAYYTGIKDSIVERLTDLYNDLVADVSWVDRKISDLAVDKSDALTIMAKFVSNTEDSLVVNHDKYLEMMTAYNSRIKDFYTRMTALYSTYERNFNENEITNIATSWKFHYASNYSDAQPVEHSFGPLNFTSESDIFELSNNRFIYMTNENVVYDVDYINKEVYIITIDSKTFANQFNQSQGSRKSYLGHERASFNSLFKLKGKTTVYALVNVGSAYVEEDIAAIANSTERASAVIGLPSDNSPIQRLIVCAYDYENHKFDILTDNTSELYVRGSVLKNHKFKFVDGTSRDYYYFYIDRFFGRFKVSGEYNANLVPKLMGTSNFEIKGAILDNDGFFTLPISETAVAIYNSTSESIDFSNPTIRTFDFISYQSQFASGEEGKVQALFYATDIGGNGTAAIYVVTDKSIWYTTDRFNRVVRDSRTNSIAITNLTFNNPDEYLIDEFGYIYVLGDNARLYCAKTIDGVSLQDTVVESPTRYADKIMNISSLVSSNMSGYLHSIDPTITKHQLSDAGGESFVHTYTKDEYDYSYDSNGILISTVFKNSTYYGITTTGKIVCYDIDAEGSSNETKKHLWTKQSICGNKEITAIIYDDDTEMFYFATSDYVVYYIAKDKLESQTVYVAHALGTVRVGSRISAICKIEDDLYIGCNSGEVHCYSLFENSNGIIEGTFHTTSTIFDEYNEADKNKYHIDDGRAIGKVAISAIMLCGSVLVICGKQGRVASCSIGSNIWTDYNGNPLNASSIESNIFDDGSALNNKDITCAVNYTDSKLIIFGEGGYIASCNLITGNWSKYDGTTINHGQTGFGPGIFNNGTILGGLNVNSCARIGTTIFAAGGQGRMGSINVATGGITEYRGTSPENNSEVAGPGYSYTGSDLANLDDTTSLAIDTYSGIVIMSGTSSFILSYSPSANEVLTPTTDKLYYIARRQSDYDYLSALLIRVTKGTLNEYSPLYPPEENEDGNYNMAYEFSYYVYQNGKYVWRISTGFDKIYFSDDYGVTYISKEIGNAGILPNILTNTIRFMAMGSVANDGSFAFVNNIAGHTFFVYGTHTDDDFDANWYSPSDNNVLTQHDLTSLYCVDNGVKHEFVITLNNESTHTLEFDDNFVVNYLFDNVRFKVIDEKSNTYEYNGTLRKQNGTSLTIDEVISSYVANVLKITDRNYNIVGMYYTKGCNFTFVLSFGDYIILMTINFVDFDEGLVEDNYSITCKYLSLNEVRLENAKNNFTENYESDITTFTIDEDSVFVVTSFDGLKGFLGFNVTITSDNFTSTDKRSVLIALSGDLYGNNYINDAAVYNVGDSAAHLICYDRTKCEVQLANYNTLDSNGIIKHVNSIHVYKEIDFIRHTPIRALSDAWKACELKMTSNGINAFAIRLKMRNTEDISEEDAISSNFTLRYQVLISDVTNGKFILYETEKSTGMSKTDDETKVVEPFIRVIAIDGFDDEIMELYTSRRDSTRRSIFRKKNISSGTKFVGGFDSRIETTYDFATYVQMRNVPSDDLEKPTKYQIKIKPLNTLPSNVDAEFFIEGYNNPIISSSITSSRDDLRNPIKDISTNIDKSEFKLVSGEIETGLGFAFGIPNSTGFLTKSQLDIGSMTKKPYNTNINAYPQYDEKESDIEYGYADTYVNIIRGEGNGLFDKLSGIVTNVGNNVWKVVPYAVNKEDIKYAFDENGSSIINANMDTKLLKNGRNLFKMRNFSVFSKGVTNDADYYSDAESGRIVRVDGSMVNPNGLFEVVSTIDGHQKRVSKVSEFKDGTIWRTVSNAYEHIKERVYGKSYDFIDRFTVFEDPYYLINAWWIPAQGNIVRGNERLLSLGFDETASVGGAVGRKYLPHDIIENSAVVESSYSGNAENTINGIVSTTNGATAAYGTRKVAIKELVDEKFPLERWAGFEWADLDFIRKWRTTYTDDTVEYTYEVEGPLIHNPSNPTAPTLGTIYTLNHIPIVGSAAYNAIPEAVRLPKPSIPRNLYSYKDNFDWEGRGEQVFKCATAYYYNSHDWKIYHVEIKKDKYDWTDQQKLDAADMDVCKTFKDPMGGNFATPQETASESKLALVEDNNFARQNKVSSEIIEDKWYIPETNNVNIPALNHDNLQYYSTLYPFSATTKPAYRNDLGLLEFDAFPRDVDGIVGEKIENLYVPVVDMVYDFEVKQPYKSIDPGVDPVNTGTIKLDAYQRGVVHRNHEEFSWNWNEEFKYEAKYLGFVNHTTFDTYPSIGNMFVNRLSTDLEMTDVGMIFSGTSNHKLDVTIKSPNQEINRNGKISFYDDNHVVVDHKDPDYWYFKHNAYNDYINYGLTGYSNNYGGVYYVQHGYWNNNSYIVRGQNDRVSEAISDPSNVYAFTDKDFILVYKSYYAKADTTDSSEFGIKTVVSEPTLNKITISTDEPEYDRYYGGSSGAYVYGRKKTVNVNLIYTYNNASDTNGRFSNVEGARVNNPYTNEYYEYSIAKPTGSDVVDEDRIWYGEDHPKYLTSRHRKPSNSTSEEVLDKLLVDFVDPIIPEGFEINPDIESLIEKVYNFIYFKNDGTCYQDSERYKNKYRWIYLDMAGQNAAGDIIDSDGNSIITPTDTSGDDFRQYKVKCMEMYQWEDYSVMGFKTEHTVQELIDNWGLNFSNSNIEVGHNGQSYTISYDITVSGRDLDKIEYHGETITKSLTSVSEVEYTETNRNIGAADPAKITTWKRDESVTGNGVSDGSNSEAVVVYDLTNLYGSNMSNAKYYEPFETLITAEEGFAVPNDISIFSGETEDLVTSDKYTYEKLPGDTQAILTIKSGVINSPIIKIVGFGLRM